MHKTIFLIIHYVFYHEGTMTDFEQQVMRSRKIPYKSCLLKKTQQNRALEVQSDDIK